MSGGRLSGGLKSYDDPKLDIMAGEISFSLYSEYD